MIDFDLIQIGQFNVLGRSSAYDGLQMPSFKPRCVAGITYMAGIFIYFLHFSLVLLLSDVCQ